MTVLPGPSAVETALVASGLSGSGISSWGTCRAERRRSRRSGRSSRAGRGRSSRSSRRNGCRGRCARWRPRCRSAVSAVCRELTKAFEEVARGTGEELAARFAEPPKGEIVLVLGASEAVRRRSGRCRGSGRARRRRRSETAGGGGRRAPHRRVPERALRGVPVSHVDNVRSLRYRAPIVYFMDNTRWLARLRWRGSLRRGSRRARASGYGAGVDVAGRRAGPAAVPVRSHAAGTPRPAPRDRRRGRRRCAGRFPHGRSRHVRRNSTGQRTDAQHSDAGRVQRHAHASRFTRGAPRSKRGGGGDRRSRRRERSPGGRRAVRASRDPSRERRGRLPRSALVPPAEAGGVSPRAAGPSRHASRRPPRSRRPP